VKLTKAIIVSPPVDVLEHEEVRRLTAEYLAVKTTSDAEGCEAVLHMGRLLAKGKPKVKGRWLGWLAQLETGRSTGGRYLAFAAFAGAHPVEFAALKPLGASKMHRVVEMSAGGLRYVMSQDLAELRQLSFRAFARATAKYLAPRRGRRVPPRQLAARVRRLMGWLSSRTLRRLAGPGRQILAVALMELERRSRALRRRL
jgi:hypothetical protein